VHSVVDFLVVVAALEVRAVHEERGVVAFADDLARVGRVQYGKRQLAARVQHTGGFAHATGQVIGVYDEVVGHDEVETVAGGGQLGRVRHQVGAVGMRLSGGFEQRRRDVDPDDPMAKSARSRPAFTTAQIQSGRPRCGYQLEER
jgi:hypothetical protein